MKQSIIYYYMYIITQNYSIINCLIKILNAKNIKYMSCKKKVKQFFKTFDFFSHNVSFRYADEPAYQSVTGGVCSIIMIITFIAIFMGTAINTLNKVYIYSTTNYKEDIDPSYYEMGTDTFMFAIGLTGFNMNVGDRWFDVYMQFRSYDNNQGVRNKTFIPLVPCNKSVWVNIGQDLGEVYDRLGFDQWLCPQPGVKMQLQGKYTSQQFKFYKFAVAQCNPDLVPDRPCVNDSQIESFLDEEQAFNFNFYFVNMILNPGSHKYMTYYLDDLNYFPFSRKSGVNANLFLSTFNITTDESIMPWQSKKQDIGGVVMNTAQMLNYQVRQDQYMKFYLRKSSLTIQIERDFRKADDTLSYVGGLFSAILSLLLLLTLYNQFSYELQIAKNIYHYEKGQPIDPDKFNFFVYLGYLIYVLFDKFSIQLPWQRMRKYHHSLEEVRKQMDIRLIMKKILYSERMAYALMQEHQSKILHLQQPLTLEEAQQIRKDHRFYQKLQQYAMKLPTGSSQQKMQDKSMDLINVNGQNSDMVQTGFRVQSSPTKFTKTSSKIILDNNQVQNIDKEQNSNKSNKRQDEQKQIDQQYQKRIQKLKLYLIKLNNQKKNGNHISQRILEKYDQELLSKIINHNDIFVEKQIQKKQRKFNLYPKQVFTFSQCSQENNNEEQDNKKK